MDNHSALFPIHSHDFLMCKGPSKKSTESAIKREMYVCEKNFKIPVYEDLFLENAYYDLPPKFMYLQHFWHEHKPVF